MKRLHWTPWVALIFVAACGGDPAPFVVAPQETPPDINVSFGLDAGSSSSGDSAGSSGVSDSAGLADGAQTANDGATSVNDATPSDTGSSADTSAVDTAPSIDTGSSGGADAEADATTADAGSTCGDGKCEAVAGESCVSCDADCGKCPASCGDNKCDAAAGEDCASCAQDCGICCGNSKCDTDKGESCLSCAADCGACCGNGKCDAAVNETCGTCPADCGQCGTCGDGKCEAQLKETCSTCAKDCGACSTCGDGKCEGNETSTTCAQDCKPADCSLPCHPVSQTGCSSNVQCYPNANSAICASFGGKKIGEACQGINDCLKGLLCVNQLCKKLCSTKAAAGFTCTSGENCEALESGGKQLPCDLGACFGDDACNLITSVNCPATHNCVPSGQGKKQCIPVGTKGQGATCTGDADCQKHFMCLGEAAGKPKTCLQKCHAGSGTPKCAAGLNCATVTTGNPPQPAGDFLGVCVK